MGYGRNDLEDFEYLIIYSEPDESHVKHTWTLPDGSFQMNYKLMKKRGCKIHNVYRICQKKIYWE